MKVCIIGTGYVGLVTGVVFAKHGFDTTCTDVIASRIDNLNNGIVPFFEPGLEELLREVVGNNLFHGSADNIESVKKSDLTFICVGTPSLPDGSIDLSYIEKAAEDIGKALSEMEKYHVVVVKSTVVPSTTDSVVLPILENHSGKKAGEHFGLAMNPEFLREGSALQDSLTPDRIVVGGYDQRSIDTVMKLYSSFDCPKMGTDLRTSEMIKYCANCFLAAKITFSNEMANICELMGIDVYEVMKGVGMDFRINPNFLRAGSGFGGSCFPKDVNAITSYSESKGYNSQILNTILDVNEIQPLRVVELAEKALGNLQGKNIALLGLSFKPDTDDVRFTRALPILEGLIEKGADIVAYDPQGIENFKTLTDKPVTYVSSAKEALKDADLCVIQTEWQEFKELSPDDFKTLMRSPIIVDGRRTFDPEELIKNGVKYFGIGWKNKL